MRLRGIRASSVPDLGQVELRLPRGLLGWVGGSARERKAVADLLRWALGLPGVAEPGSAAWTGRSGPASVELDVRVVGVEVTLRDRKVPVAPDAGEAAPPHELLGLTPEELSLVWAGGPGAEPDRLLADGARLLARTRGLDRMRRALAELGHEVEAAPGAIVPRTDDPAQRARLEAELAEVEARLADLADVPERLRSLEAELRSLRADAAELAGDLEAATMEWLRERQDAETHLQTYRDQARELRDRMRELESAGPESPCPFCGRTLGDHHEEVMSELRDEWESLVQDGSWWRRRREQLELKPDRLQELEGRTLRSQAAVEACAERLERCRFDLRERDELRSRRVELLEMLGRSPVDAPHPAGLQATEAAGEERRRVLAGAFRRAQGELLADEEKALTRAAGTYLNRITGGRILGLHRRPEGGVGLLEDGRPLAAPTGEDRAATVVAFRLALGERLVEAGVPLRSLVLNEPVRDLNPEARLRTVALARGLLARLPQILLLSGDDVVDAAPEAFDRIVEVRGAGAGEGPSRLRLVRGGAGFLRLE